MEYQLIKPDETMQPHANESTRRNTIDDPLADMAYAAITPTCDRLGVRHYDRIKRLRAVLADLTELHTTGANEVELRAYEEAIASHIDGLTAGEHATDLTIVARMELDADIAEDAIEGLIAIEGQSPMLLEKHVSALRKQSVTSRVRARVVARIARSLRATRTVAASRLGVGGAA